MLEIKLNKIDNEKKDLEKKIKNLEKNSNISQIEIKNRDVNKIKNENILNINNDSCLNIN